MLCLCFPLAVLSPLYIWRGLRTNLIFVSCSSLPWVLSAWAEKQAALFFCRSCVTPPVSKGNASSVEVCFRQPSATPLSTWSPSHSNVLSQFSAGLLYTCRGVQAMPSAVRCSSVLCLLSASKEVQITGLLGVALCHHLRPLLGYCCVVFPCLHGR